MNIHHMLEVVVLGVTLTMTGCAEQMMKTTPIDASLYDRLGGKSAISTVVDDFVGRVANDSWVNA